MSRLPILFTLLALLLTACGGHKPYIIKNRFPSPYLGGPYIDITDESASYNIFCRDTGDSLACLFMDYLGLWRQPNIIAPLYTYFIPRTQSGTFGIFYFSGSPENKKIKKLWNERGTPAFLPLYHYQIKNKQVVFSKIPSWELDAMPFTISCDEYDRCRKVFSGIYWDVFRIYKDRKQEYDKTQQGYHQVYFMRYEEGGVRDWRANDLLLQMPMSSYWVDTTSILEGTLDKRRLGFEEVYPKQDFLMLDTLSDKLYKYPELDTAILSLPGKVFREKYMKGKIKLPLY